MTRRSRIVRVGAAALTLIPILAFAEGRQTENQSLPVSSQQQKKEDAELLARALDYFVSRKYHECLILLERLDKTYRLNPRYKAYLGVCYYYEWDYEQTVRCLDPVIPLLENFAPQERSFYCWADAESHFGLQQYESALPLYEQMLSLCKENEKPDAYYRLGFCHLFRARDMEKSASREDMMTEYTKARDYLRNALKGYLRYRNTADEKARIAQIQHMLKGMW